MDTGSLATACTCTPLPAWVQLMAKRPTNRAMAVAAKKYEKAFTLMRPTWAESFCAAIPTTRVPNSSGAMMVLMS